MPWLFLYTDIIIIFDCFPFWQIKIPLFLLAGNCAHNEFAAFVEKDWGNFCKWFGNYEENLTFLLF